MKQSDRLGFFASAAEHLARHPAAGKEEVARAAGFHEKYFTRGKGAKLWDALKPRSNAIRRGYRRRDDSGEATGEVDAPDGADEAA